MKRAEFPLEKLFEFINFTYQFQQIKRVIHVKDEDTLENDSEHSFQLTLAAWYLIELNKFKLDINKVIKLALVHDLVEVYAGDTFAFASEEIKRTKKEREEKAIEKLNQNFPDFTDLNFLMREYKELQTPESKYVYVLDKVLPVINTYLNDGRMWREKNMNVEDIHGYIKEKVLLSPELIPYHEQLLKILKKRRDLFDKNKILMTKSF